ncbi:MAG: hypothetical protein AB1716_14860 [Planctomycetota bacterium]
MDNAIRDAIDHKLLTLLPEPFSRWMVEAHEPLRDPAQAEC